MTAPAREAERNGLIELGGRPPLRRYLPDLWRQRHFAIELARSRFRAANEEDRLGILWNVLGPLLNAAVYGVVFKYLLPSSSRPSNFIPFLVTGVFIFQFFSACFQGGARAIVGNMGLIRSLHFPRATLPISLVIQQIYALVPMVVVLVLVVLATGEPITWKWLEVIPALVLMSIFCTGVAFVAARLTIHIRDLAQLIPFITRIMFYVSGVFYNIERTFQQPVLRQVLTKNPVYIYIALVRDGLVTVDPIHFKDRTVIEPYATAGTWWMAVIWAFGLALIGFLYFWRAEEVYGRE